MTDQSRRTKQGRKCSQVLQRGGPKEGEKWEFIGTLHIKELIDMEWIFVSLATCRGLIK